MNETFGGMTVNERLSAAKLLTAFDEAIVKRDEARLREILTFVEVDVPSINAIIERYIPANE